MPKKERKAREIKTHHPARRTSALVIGRAQAAPAILAAIAGALLLRHSGTRGPAQRSTLADGTRVRARLSGEAVRALAFPGDRVAGRAVPAFAVVRALRSPLFRRTT